MGSFQLQKKLQKNSRHYGLFERKTKAVPRTTPGLKPETEQRLSVEGCLRYSARLTPLTGNQQHKRKVRTRYTTQHSSLIILCAGNQHPRKRNASSDELLETSNSITMTVICKNLMSIENGDNGGKTSEHGKSCF